MNILLTGASGFVGRHILRTLKKSNHIVRCVLREGSQLESDLVADDIVYTPDLFEESLQNLESFCKDIDIVIHCAWYVKSQDYDSELNISCLQGGLNLAKASVTQNIKRFVGIGSCFEYEFGDEFLSVKTPLNPHTLYGSSKVALFLTLSKYFSSRNIDFAWLRLFFLYGEGEEESRLFPYIHKCMRENTIVHIREPHVILDYMDVSKAADEIVAISLNQEAIGAMNICTGEPVTVGDLAESIASQYGKKNLLRFPTKAHCDELRIIGKR